MIKMKAHVGEGVDKGGTHPLQLRVRNCTVTLAITVGIPEEME